MLHLPFHIRLLCILCNSPPLASVGGACAHKLFPPTQGGSTVKVPDYCIAGNVGPRKKKETGQGDGQVPLLTNGFVSPPPPSHQLL